MKKPVLWLTGILISIIAVWFIIKINVPYVIHTKCIAYPNIEWSVTRTVGGDFITTLKDNLSGQVSSRNISQYIKGDEARFLLSPSLEKAKSVQAGDTVGFIQSEEESLRLMTLDGELEVQKASLALLSSGEKPTVISEATRRLEMAEMEIDIQSKLLGRLKSMLADSLVSSFEVEMAMKQLRIKELSAEVARATLETMKSGEKTEQLKVTSAKIANLEDQISILKKRQSGFTILSPISGKIIKRKRIFEENQVAITVIDTVGFVSFAPVPLYESPWISKSYRVRLNPPGSINNIEGTILSIDNSVQIINGKQSIFITAGFPVLPQEIMPGEVMRTVIYCPEVSLWEYFNRIVEYFLN